ncbi:MAG: hypothetical protein CMJ32_01135 [Phycisphaerae bacterium]|nr:hypothetical protein [Phycisphaerae bacterium]
MNWGLYIVALVIAMVLDVSFVQVFAINHVIPSLAMCLLVFVCLYASRDSVLWAALLMGLLLDMTDVHLYMGSRPYHLVGPHVLGCFFAVCLVLPLRAMVFRRNPLAIGVMTVLLSIAVSLVYCFLWQIRSWYPDVLPPWSPEGVGSAFWRLVLCSLYSGLIAMPLGWLLTRTLPAWGFAMGNSRTARRG